MLLKLDVTSSALALFGCPSNLDRHRNFLSQDNPLNGFLHSSRLLKMDDVVQSGISYLQVPDEWRRCDALIKVGQGALTNLNLASST